MFRFGPDNPSETYVAHAFLEHMINTGEVTINYAVAGEPDKPALLLIPGQTESWWGISKRWICSRRTSRRSRSICADRDGRAGRRAAACLTTSVTDLARFTRLKPSVPRSH
jgi:hypothetical protein